MYSAYPIKRPPRKSLPLTPPDSPEPLGAEAPPLPPNNPGAPQEREGIFESQSSLMTSLRNSGNLQKNSTGLRESLILASISSNTSDDGVCHSLPEDGGSRSMLGDQGQEGDIDSDPEYSDAAWTKDDSQIQFTSTNQGLLQYLVLDGSFLSPLMLLFKPFLLTFNQLWRFCDILLAVHHIRSISITGRLIV